MKLGSGTTNFAVGEKVVAWVDIKVVTHHQGRHTERMNIWVVDLEVG